MESDRTTGGDSPDRIPSRNMVATTATAASAKVTSSK
jgi:hypothetical protein